MTRKALIISNPGEIGAENYCQGVNLDVEKYKNFLMSPQGGAWYEHEIVCIKRPYPHELNSELQKMSYVDYSVIIFTGHGCIYEDKAIIELKKDYDYNAESFRNTSNKRTIILDCCREIESSILTPIYEMSHMYIEKRAMSSLDARKYYEELLSLCRNEVVIMYACDVDETAGDDSKKGGYYSYNLIKAANTWVNNTTNYKDKASVVAVHNTATTAVQSLSKYRQNPQIEKPRSDPYFPFVIKV